MISLIPNASNWFLLMTYGRTDEKMKSLATIFCFFMTKDNLGAVHELKTSEITKDILSVPSTV